MFHNFMMDTVIDKVYNVARGGEMFMFWFQEVSMHKFPFGPIFIMGKLKLSII